MRNLTRLPSRLVKLNRIFAQFAATHHALSCGRERPEAWQQRCLHHELPELVSYSWNNPCRTGVKQGFPHACKKGFRA